jgi:hypothetical protein
VNLLNQLQKQAHSAGVHANDLIRAGIGRSTAYAFLQGKPKNFT